MRNRVWFISVLALLAAGGILASLGEQNPDVSLASVRAIWADVLRDADQIGYKATRVSAQEEMDVGRELADARWGVEDPATALYLAAVAAPLLEHVRRKDIQYTFHAIESPGINAFALPGGQIFVQRGLLNFLHSEAELAAILGHEIAHVDLRHAIERYQYELALKKVGARDVGAIIEIAHGIVTIGYTQYQDLEADAEGERLAIEAGYDPDAGPNVFHRMQQRWGEFSRVRATTPAGEVAQSIGTAIVSYFRTHPTSEERERQLEELVAGNQRRLAGQTFYVGVRNYGERRPRSEVNYPQERRVFVP